MANDWVDDSTLSTEETLARFRDLDPEPTRAPDPKPGVAVGTHGFIIINSRSQQTHGVLLTSNPA